MHYVKGDDGLTTETGVKVAEIHERADLMFPTGKSTALERRYASVSIVELRFCGESM